MENISFEFEYSIPDEFLHQTDNLKLTAKWTYTGPEYLWVFVDKDTGKFDFSSYYLYHDLTKEKQTTEHAKLKAGRNYVPVLINAKENPVIASFFMNVDFENLSKKEYKKGSEVYFSRPDPTPPVDTYEVDEIFYDLTKKEWKTPFPWKRPYITTEQLNDVRVNIIKSIEEDLENNNLDSKLKEKLKKYKIEMEEIPTKFKDCDPWTIPFPIDPRSIVDS